MNCVGCILQRQDHDPALRAVAAAQQLFYEAKRIRSARFLPTWLLGLATPTMYLLGWTTASGLVLVFNVAWLLTGRLWLLPAERSRRSAAASQMEVFESIALGLPRRLVQLGVETDDARARELAERYRRRTKAPTLLQSRVKGWFEFPPAVHAGSAVLYAQRYSAEYGRRLARAWASVLTALWATLVLLMAMTVYIVDLGFATAVTFFVSPLLPITLDLIDSSLDQRRSLDARARVLRATDSWKDCHDDGQLALDVRDLMHLWRRETSPVAEWFYVLNRSRIAQDLAKVLA